MQFKDFITKTTGTVFHPLTLMCFPNVFVVLAKLFFILLESIRRMIFLFHIQSKIFESNILGNQTTNALIYL